jgi:hypothetical protein
MIRAALLLVLAAAAAGCHPPMHGASWGRAYTQNDDCAVADADAASRAVRWTMCGVAEPLENTPRLDVEATPIEAARYVASCAASASCDPGSGRTAWLPLAHAWDLATRLDPDRVAAAVAAAQVPGYMRSDFVARYRASRDRVIAVVDGLGPDFRDQYLRPMTEARARRAAADEALAAWPAKARAITARADLAIATREVTAAMVEDALALRRAYVAACRQVRDDVEVCLADVVTRTLADTIQRMAVARGDVALAAVEKILLGRPDRSDPRSDENLAIRAALGDGDAQRYVPVPGWTGNGMAYLVDDAIQVRDEVRSVQRKGDRAVVLFKKDVYRGSYSTGCHDTDKPIAVDGGKVIYESSCTGEKRYSDDRTTKPVEVPWVEVAHVKAKQRITVYVDPSTRRGYVADLERAVPKEKDEWVSIQVREFVVPAAAK